jgi:hypothetical protein
MDSLEARLDALLRGVLASAKSTILALLLAGWSGLWLLVLVGGLAFAVQALIVAGGGVLAATWGSLGLRALLGRRRLVRRARRELMAQLRLEGRHRALDAELRATLTAFDATYARALGLLEAGPLLDSRLMTSAQTELERVRARVHAAAVGKVEQLAHLGRLSTDGHRPAVAQALEDARRAAREHQAEADELLGTTRDLAERLAEVRRLARPDGRAALVDVLEALDRTRSAYREIEAAEAPAEPRGREARVEAARARERS